MPYYYFGFNGFGQILGNGMSDKQIKKVEWQNTEWTKLSLTWSTICFVNAENELDFLGFNRRLKDSDSIKVSEAAACDKFVVAITKEGLGKVYTPKHQGLVEVKQIELHKDKLVKCCVGDSDALFINEVGKVVRVSLKEKIEEHLLPLAWKVNEISCGKEHVLLLNENGTVYSFGQGSRGQLGHGTVENESSPCPVECLEGIPVKHIAAGGWHSAAVTTNGDLFTWGWNESGQLGLPTTRKQHTTVDPEEGHDEHEEVSVQATPTCVHFNEDVVIDSVGCGSRHTMAVTSVGQLWAFGWNSHGQLGLGSRPFFSKPTLVQDFLPAGEMAVDVRCGGWSTLVLTGQTGAPPVS